MPGLLLPAPIIKLGLQITPSPDQDPPMSYIEATDTSLRKTGQIKLHGPSGFAGMRKAGALVAKCLDELTDIVKPGVPTSEIDEFVRDFAFSHGAYPATLMYRGYRYSTCTSINHVVCHGMPGDRRAEGRRHRQYRRHLHRRRLVRQFQPDVCGRPDRAQGRAADRGDL